MNNLQFQIRTWLSVSLLILTLVTGGFAQTIWEPDGLRMPGDWNGWTNNHGMGGDFDLSVITDGTRRWTTSFEYAGVTGVNNFKFASGGDGNAWGNEWRDQSFTPNNLASVGWSGGGAANNNNTINVENSKFYTVLWKDNGYASTDAIFMETSAEPANILSVTQDPAGGDINPDTDVTVSITTNVAPSAEENFFVWYTISGNHSVVEMVFTGTTATADIPGQPSGSAVSYRVISSTIALANGENTEYYWMRSIKYSDQSSYTVALPAPGSITLTAPADEAAGILPEIAFSWDAEEWSDTYTFELSKNSDFDPVVESVSGIAGTSITRTMFGSYYWRVRGENGAGNGAWSQRSFTTVAPQITISGNVGGGFGGVVGSSTLKIGHNGASIYGHFTKGPDALNDALVIYISNGNDGRSLINSEVNDQGDNLRRAISSAGDNASELAFPADFEATHAIAIDQGFAGLWSIPPTGAIGNNELVFVTALNKTPTGAGAVEFAFSLNFANLGIGNGDPFDMLGIYLNGGNGFTSNEGFGFVAPDENIGAGDLAFTSYFNYPTGNEVSPPYSLQTGDWNAITTWSTNEVPANTASVNIHDGHTVAITDERQIADVAINSGGVLEIGVAGGLNVTDKLTNNGALLIKSNSTGTGSLLHETAGVPATIQRFVNGSDQGTAKQYHLVSVPITQEDNPEASLFMHSYLFSFDAGIQDWDLVGDDPNFDLQVDEGYMIWYTGASTTYNFTGHLNTGAFPAAMGSGASVWNAVESRFDGGYNLVPNPYPSALDWDIEGGFVGTNLFNTIYIYDRVSGNYGSYVRGDLGVGTNNVSNIIPAGQSFFVQATEDGAPTLSLNNLARTLSNNNIVKKNQVAVDKLRLSVQSGDYSDELLIGFDNAASNAFDPSMDAQKLRGSAEAPQIYSLSAEGVQLSINKMPYQNETVIVPVGFELAAETAEAVFNFSNLDSFGNWITVFFEDLLTGEMIDIREQPVYNFTHNEGDAILRFRLHFMGVTSVDDMAAANHHIWSHDDRIYITMPESFGNMVRIELFDLLGNRVMDMSRSLDNPTIIRSTAKGVVIVRVTEAHRVYTQKLFIR